MKKFIFFMMAFLLLLFLPGCTFQSEATQIAATTLPVYEFTVRICEGTDLNIQQLVSEEVSCLHDYTLQTAQMKTAESAEVLIISGAGLESFMEDIIDSASVVIDSSCDVHMHTSEHHHDHGHTSEEHHHDTDPHIWLSPENAMVMANNICNSLCNIYPAYSEVFTSNCQTLIAELVALQEYGDQALANISTRELITFHDGFSYFAEAFDLSILHAVEEESGSEASAAELIALISLVQQHNVPAIFTEINGSTAAAEIISSETGGEIYTLSMAMSGNSYFEAMYHNINTIREALE